MNKRFLVWWLIVVMQLIALGAAVYYNAIPFLIENDSTRLSFAIIIMWSFASASVGYRSFKGRDVDKFITYLKESDMVIGTRTTRQMIEQGSNMDWITRWANVMFAKIIEILWWNSDPGITPRFTDVGCTYRAIWKSSFEEIEDYLKAPGPEFAVEMMLALMCTRQRIIEIPISYFNRIGGESKHSNSFLSKAKTAFKMMKVTLKIRLFKLKK
mgnify:CR=1 FL=1